MEDYKMAIKKRLSLMIGFNSIVVVFIVLIGYLGNTTVQLNENISDMIHGFQVGIFIGIQILIVIQIKKYNTALKSKDALKKLYIEEHDERTKLIKDKIGGMGLNLCICGIGAATVTAGFFSKIVFITLLSVLIYTVLVKGFFKVYYRKKY
ncbi:hypothetical protein SH2C18_28960 [Clostridium sediminicola]|uniref:hypothetical protein n=1 Tax=Clostridium sediminicola TaxID=3114879 RepID=UPI0031F1CE64